MNTLLLRFVFAGFLAMFMGVALTGCDDDAGEKAADSIGDTAREASDSVGDAADEVKDSVD